MKALGIATAARLPRFVSQQVYLSLHERSAEYEIVPSALDQGLGLLVWSPLAGGLMSGKYRRGQSPPPGSRRAGEWNEPSVYDEERLYEPPVYDEQKLYDTIEVLVELAESRGVSAARMALAWLLTRPGITTVIVGARDEDQLADNLAAAELELSADEIERLESVSRPPLIYPYWHQQTTASDRLSSADLSLIGPFLESHHGRE
jgi:aryl-alcohol dehydrogenase-like predicted oxidoreductase